MAALKWIVKKEPAYLLPTEKILPNLFIALERFLLHQFKIDSFCLSPSVEI